MYLAYGARALAAVALAAATLGVAAASTDGTVTAAPTVTITPGVQHQQREAQAGPSTTAECEQSIQIACYNPAQLQRAYNLPALYSRGITGKGATIVVIDPYGSPTIGQRPAHLRSRRGRAQPALAADHQARGQGPRLQPEQRQHGRLGQRDHARRGVRAHDRARREDPAGRDAGRREDRDRQHGSDRHGREVRDQAPSRQRDQPELRGHRAGHLLRRDQVAARRLPGRERRRTSRCWPARATAARPASSRTSRATTPIR